TAFDGSQIEVTWAKPVDKTDNARLGRLSNTNTNSSALSNLYPVVSRMMHPTVNNVLGSALTDNSFKIPISNMLTGPIPINCVPPAFATPLTTVPFQNPYRALSYFQNSNDFAGLTTTSHPMHLNTLTLVQQPPAPAPAPTAMIPNAYVGTSSLTGPDSATRVNTIAAHSPLLTLKGPENLQDQRSEFSLSEMGKMKANSTNSNTSFGSDGTTWFDTGLVPDLKDIHPDPMQVSRIFPSCANSMLRKYSHVVIRFRRFCFVVLKIQIRNFTKCMRLK
ncbi:unnamed protein product, partial [Echinostoma caproni]|uniref:Fibronectin type-III domain-containing protein n=1 Tax=Echinostoma caproni TaxID=27848 RepID=A0A183AYE5_9TREM